MKRAVTNMKAVQAVVTAMKTETHFRHACNMERPLASIRNLATALAMLAETMSDDEGTVIQELAWSIRDLVPKLEEEHEYFFRLHHPNRD